MGIISIEKADHLFWLGRYTERVFTTLRMFFRYFDQMLDIDERAFEGFCEKLAIPVIYQDMDDFIDKYLFSAQDPNSVYSNLMRALDNGVVLRDELSSDALSYIQMTLDCMEQVKAHSSALAYDLQPVKDYLFAFWGCLDDNMEDEEGRNIIKCGKYLERLDLYMRLDFPYPYVEKEFSKFMNRLGKVRIGYRVSEADRLAQIICQKEEWEARRQDGLDALWNIF